MESYLYELNLYDACILLRFTQALIMHGTHIQIRFAFLFPDRFNTMFVILGDFQSPHLMTV